jgi:predicted permease
VVGVTPPEFFGIDPAAAPDLYLPLHSNVLLEAANPFGTRANTYLAQNEYWIEMMARLRPGVSITQAQAALAPQFHQWVDSTASNDIERANLPTLLVQQGGGGLESLRRQYSKPLYFLMTLVGLILAIACANIANLLLARATARRGEMALRLSLGAGRLRLVRQLLTESVMLASFGGLLGILFAVWGIRLLTLLLANGQTDFTLHANLNWHVLGVAAALSISTGVLFGLAPALQSTRVDVVPALKKLRASESRSRVRLSLSRVLVVLQIALSLLMLVAAGLFGRTLSNLQSVETGFNRENVLLFHLNARQAGHRETEIISFYKDLQERFRTVPGVRNVSLANYPLIGWGHWGTNISVSDKPVPRTVFLTVGPEFFTTMQIPIVLGRGIGERDQPGSPAVVVVSELFAKTSFGNENPVGHHLTFGGGGSSIPARDMEIVGVTRNARYGDLKHDTPPVVYVAYNQNPMPVDEMTYTLRTAGDPLAYVNTVREIVHRADARVPVDQVRTQAAEIDQTINQEIIFARLCTAFAVLALMIAAVGLYGTMSYNVARRTGEIGIRMALGAQRGTVIWMVLREVLILAAVGLAISVPAAFLTSKLVESFLFGMKPNDPLAMTLAVATLLSAALLAGYLPARKASRIDPMIALRHE